MPLFYFQTRRGDALFDREGITLRNLSEAEREAIAATGEMLRDIAQEDGLRGDEAWTTEVLDENGTLVCSLTVSVQAGAKARS